jgi:CxC5 like cysteine cluster associated with KDZ transposases
MFKFVLQIDSCTTSYHDNYSVNAEFRTYYGGVPNLIQVGEHQFIKKRVVNLFIGMMLVAWYV